MKQNIFLEKNKTIGSESDQPKHISCAATVDVQEEKGQLLKKRREGTKEIQKQKEQNKRAESTKWACDGQGQVWASAIRMVTHGTGGLVKDRAWFAEFG